MVFLTQTVNSFGQSFVHRLKFVKNDCGLNNEDDISLTGRVFNCILKIKDCEHRRNFVIGVFNEDGKLVVDLTI